MLDVDDLIFAAMQASGGRIEGRTRLQKLVFFLSEVLGVEAGYRPHFYGPYSSPVSAAAESQASRGALREMVEEFPGVSGFAGNDDEYRRYVYSLTGDGRQALQWRRQRNPEEFDEAVKLANRAIATGANYRVLSYAAKLYYVLRAAKQEASLTYASARRRAKELGWEMSREDIDRGVDLLLRMKLVTKRTTKAT
jgi:uncharacterized protein YwgA